MSDGFGGRSRVEIEQDVLASMVYIEPFRGRAVSRVTLSMFTTSEHQRLYRALVSQRGTIDDPDLFVSRTLGIPIGEAHDWLLDSLPTTYDSDLEWLCNA